MAKICKNSTNMYQRICLIPHSPVFSGSNQHLLTNRNAICTFFGACCTEVVHLTVGVWLYNGKKDLRPTLVHDMLDPFGRWEGALFGQKFPLQPGKTPARCFNTAQCWSYITYIGFKTCQIVLNHENAGEFRVGTKATVRCFRNVFLQPVFLRTTESLFGCCLCFGRSQGIGGGRHLDTEMKSIHLNAPYIKDPKFTTSIYCISYHIIQHMTLIYIIQISYSIWPHLNSTDSAVCVKCIFNVFQNIFRLRLDMVGCSTTRLDHQSVTWDGDPLACCHQVLQ